MSRDVPRGAIRFNVGLQILAMILLVAGANFFSFNHYVRVDCSRSQRFVLSEQTKRVLRELKNPVHVVVFFSRSSPAPETSLYPDVSNLLKELIFSGRKKIKVEYVDPTRDLARARTLQGEYKFSANENVLILDYDGRTKFIPVADMADFDPASLAPGNQPRLLSFKGEQAITNALIALISPEKKKVYFLQGHGEPPVEGATPLRLFEDYIERQNTKATPLSLASMDSVPEDCAALMIVAPQADISDREATILEHFWSSQQGRLMVLLDPAIKTPKLNAVLAGAGIIPQDDRVLRVVPLSFATGILREVTAEFQPGNAITKRLAAQGMNIFFKGATQSLDLDTAQAKSAGVQLWPLIEPAEAFWGERDYVTDDKKGVRYDEGRDVGQPLYVAAAAARGGVNDERVEVESSKMIVVGSCQFAFDAAMTPAGLDFLLSSANWLLDRGDLTGVMPKNVQNFSLNLTDQQLGLIALYSMIVIPGVVALLGIIVWFRRRA